MEEQRNKDGLTRKKQAELLQVKQPFYALEEDFSNLFARAMHLGGIIRYYTSTQRPDGYFASLYEEQPLVILNEINQYDTETPEREFIRLAKETAEAKHRGRNTLTQTLYTQVTEWHARLNRPLLQKEKSLLKNEVNRYNRLLQNLPLTDSRSTQRIFYFLLRYIRSIQKEYDRLLEDLLHNGANDPSLAVLMATIKNYQYLVRKFNDRWKQYPLFYLEKILQAEARKEILPRAWFIVRKNPETACHVLPEQTGFIATISAQLPPVCYRSRQTYYLNNMQFSRIYSLLLDKNKEKYPASQLNYVTSVLQKELNHCIEVLPEGEQEKKTQLLFEHPGIRQENLLTARFAATGLVIESPLLMLREGIRHVHIRFGLEPDSMQFFLRLIQTIRQTSDSQRQVVGAHYSEVLTYKVLNDAFYLEISTPKGWTAIPNYLFSLHEETQAFDLKFHLDETFPATSSCSDLRRLTTRHPALRILMNRDAWLFPYSWATKIKLRKLTITTEVSGLTTLEVHNELGQIDPATPFPPFGAQPVKGSWLAFGNYEMALKPVTRVGLSFRWQQLPGDECGFYDRYQGYPGGIDNTSFRVRMEQLADKRWVSIPGSLSYLFATEGKGNRPAPRATLSDYSAVACAIKETLPPLHTEEEKYRYGLTRSGFYRMVLETPDTGFGQSVYRQLFADIMMQNAFRRKKLTPPPEPVLPVVDGIEASYTATETYDFNAGKQYAELKLYHINPLQANETSPANTGQAVPFFVAPEQEGNLLFAIRHARGNSQIRILTKMAPLKREVDDRELPHLQWYYLNGKEWCPFKPEDILTDTTESFLCSGLIELNLPEPVAEEQLDANGDFWLAAAVTSHTSNCSALISFYLNPVEACLELGPDDELTEEWLDKIGTFSGKFDFEKTEPHLTDVYQVIQCQNGRPAETAEDTKVRTFEQIMHRSRAILPADYEQLVLLEFPEVEKVLCLPGLDSKGLNRKGIVSLAVMQKEADKKILPLCENKLLVEIERFLQCRVSPFVTVDAIPPVYEKITVRGWLKVAAGKHTGLVIRQAEERIDGCIAPWYREGEIPVFGHSFSFTDLYNTIREDEVILDLTHLSVLHVLQNGSDEKEYFLNRYFNERNFDFVIAPSQPWCILVPDEEHLLSVTKPETDRQTPGIGDLRVGGTFIINE